MYKKLNVFIILLAVLISFFIMPAYAKQNIEIATNTDAITFSSGSKGISFCGDTISVYWYTVGGAFSGTITINGVPVNYSNAVAGVSSLGHAGALVSYTGTLYDGLSYYPVSGSGIVTSYYTLL
jgi:hypothetical protein